MTSRTPTNPMKKPAIGEQIQGQLILELTHFALRLSHKTTSITGQVNA
jgi:hypothetical protein